MAKLKKKLKKGAGFTLGAVSDLYGRSRQASLGFFTGDDPVESVQQAVTGFRSPKLNGKDRYRPEDLGFVRSLPEGGLKRVLTKAEEAAIDPLTLGTAAFGPAIAGGIRSVPVVGKLGAGFVAPVLEHPNVLARLGAEMGVAASSGAGAQIAEELAPDSLKPYAPLAGGLAGGAFAIKTIGNIRAAQAALNAPTPGIGGASVDKLTELIKKSKRAEWQQSQLYRQARGPRSGAFREAYEKGGFNPASFAAASKRLGGKLPRVTFDFPDGENVDAADVSVLMERIFRYYPQNRGLSVKNTTDAFQRLVFEKKLPTKSELREFEAIFGTKFVTALLGKRGKGEILHENLIDILNLPRALMSSMDISAPFNQGVMAITRKEWWSSWEPMLKAFASEKGAADAAESIRRGRYYDRGLRAKLHEASLGRIGDGEEAFASRFARAIPGVRRSERAYVTFLNKLRWDLWENNIAKFERAGMPLTREDERKLANVYNVLTGRGNMPGREVADVLNASLFSPRRLTSIVERATYAPVAVGGSLLEGAAGKQILPGSMIARREAARDLVGFISTGVGVLTLMNLTGIADVEVDPRSPDFGKGRIGNTRYDPWGGFQQVARYVTQVATGTRKDSLGNISPADRSDTFWRFWQSKLAPVQGLIVDAKSGRTMTGDTVDLTNSNDIKEQAFNRLTPLFIQNINEAAKEEGSMGFLKALPGGTGIGVQTYETISDVRNRVLLDAAQVDPELADKTWEELTTGQQQRLEEQYKGDFDKVRVQSDYEDERMAIEESIHERQRELNAKLNDPVAPIAPEQFRREMDTLIQTRKTRLEEARQNYGIKYQDKDTVVNKWYDLREQAQAKYGIVDPMELDEIQEDFYATLTRAEQKQVDDLREYRPDPSVKWYYDAKDAISEGGYWDVQKKALAQLKDKLPPGVETLYDLMSSVQVAALAGDEREAARRQAILNAVNTISRAYRLRLRKDNKKLDEAVVLIYGVKPIWR